MKYAPLILAAGFFLSSPHFIQSAAAQTSPEATPIAEPVELSNDPAYASQRRKVVRTVDPITYWVEAEQLPIRNNPVAGDVISMLQLGQKIKAYGTFENWLRISKAGEPEKWVNSQYVTSDQLTWARFDNKRRRSAGYRNFNTADDVSLERVKVPNSKDAKVYAASVKTTDNGNRVIVTRQNFRSGPYFEKRLVSCAEPGTALRFQLLGEGHNYIRMEKDIRASQVDINSASPRTAIEAGVTSAKTIAIANHSCKS